MGRGTSKITGSGGGFVYKDIGLGRVENPMKQIPQQTVLDALRLAPADLTTAGAIEEVSIDSLYSPQSYLYSDKLDYMRSNGFGVNSRTSADNEALVVNYQGKNLLVDGTHRIAMERERGNRKIKIRVIRV